MPNENIPYILVGGFAIVFVIFWFMGGKFVVSYLLDSLKKKQKSAKIKNSISFDISMQETNDITTKEKEKLNAKIKSKTKNSHQRKGEFLYNSIKNDLTGFTDTEEKQYVADILLNLPDEEFDQIMMEIDSK